VKGETFGAAAMAILAIWWLNRPPPEAAQRDPAAGANLIRADSPAPARDSMAMIRVAALGPARASAARASTPPPVPAKRPWTPPRLKASTLGAFLREPTSPPITIHTQQQDLTAQAQPAKAPDRAPERLQEARRPETPASRADAPEPARRSTPASDLSCRITASPQAPLRYNERVRYLDVSGDEAAVRRAIRSVPCTRPDAAGCTNTRFTQSCAPAAAAGSCRANCTVTLAVEIIYPRWDGRGSADLKARWARFKETIEIHENSHKAIAIRHGNSLARRLAGAVDESCIRAGGMGSIALDEMLAELEAEQARYDARGCHAEL